MATKRCSGCGAYKPYSEFYKNRGRNLDLTANCKECNKADNLRWKRSLNGEKLDQLRAKRNKNEVLRRHGLSRTDLRLLEELAGGVCQVCGTTDQGRRLAVDHCHNGGGIRGMLCFRCNSILGRVNDDPELLRSLAAYLEDPPAQGLLLMGKDQLTLEDAAG